MTAEEYRKWVEQWFQKRGTAAGKTLTIVSLLLVVYQGLLIVVESTDTDTVAAFVQRVLSDGGPAFWVLSPFVHQAHDLLLANLIAWIPLGYLFARHTDRNFFFGHVFGVAYVTNLVAPLIPRILGIPSADTVGFSGVVYALVIQETLYIIAVAYETSEFSLRVLASGIICVFFLALYLFLIMNPNPGTSIWAHGAGLCVGLMVGMYYIMNRELARRDNWVSNIKSN